MTADEGNTPADQSLEAEQEKLAEMASEELARAGREDDESRFHLYRPFHNVTVEDGRQGEMEGEFEAEVAQEIKKGDLHVPAGGPVTPEEAHEVEVNPWPGHTMSEAVERLRAQRAGQPAADGAPEPPA